MEGDLYRSPLGTRYASRAMRENFSERKKFTTWRRLWAALAESEAELGLPITGEQLAELRARVEDLDLELAERYERELRHDVMAHVHAYGEQCPTARPILHLGATSCFVTDNTELIQLRDGLEIVLARVVAVVRALREFALEWRSLPTLGFTHFQPAQATTVGKRASLWLQDFVHDVADLEHARSQLRFRGVKGTTGTQASFLALFDGDHDKVRELDRRVTERMGFSRTYAVTGQTYPRQLDSRVLGALSQVAQSAHKLAVDVRLLAHRRELAEPFGTKQIGSSAMPWKRNPMRCERICALARFVMSLTANAEQTAANQWLERTLDDSANRRLALAEAFLATDAVLLLVLDVARGLVVNPEVVRAKLAEELPFLATERILMEAVRAGADRQDAHEAIRRATHAAVADLEAGRPPDLAARLAADPLLAPHADRLAEVLRPELHVGRAPEQVVEFVEAEVDPLLARYEGLEPPEGEVRV